MEQIFLVTMAIVLTITSSALAVIAWKRSRRDYRRSFALLMLAEVVMVWGYMMDVSSPTLSGKLQWNSVEYIGYLFAIPLFFTFNIQFAWDLKMSRRWAALIFLPAALFFVALLTNEYHHLFYVSTTLTPDVYRSFQAVYGPVFYAYMVYAFALLLGGLAALVYHYLKASRTHRNSIGITVLACGLAVAVVLFNYIMIYSIPGSLVVVVGLLVSSLLLFIGAFGFELFSMVPFALEKAMSTMRGGVIIVDDRDKVLFQNPAATEMLGGLNAYGQIIHKLVPGLPYQYLIDREGDDHSDEAYEVLPSRFFEVQVVSIRNHNEKVIGRTIYLRELTAEIVAQEEAKLARDKLELMNGITRHDINNQLTVLEGRLMLAANKAGKGELAEHIAISARAARLISKQMKFAKDYQELGIRAPVWHDVAETFKVQAASMGLQGISLELDTEGALVNADPMLERVFFNLMDNSLAHGQKVTRITVSARRSPEGMAIIYTDDGVGIPLELKGRLFTKGAGKGNGLALYLSKEILAYGGMSITEAGIPGEGVKFIITIPPGKFRFPASNDEEGISTAEGIRSVGASPVSLQTPMRGDWHRRASWKTKKPKD